MEERKGRRVIFFPLPFQGHLNPMLQLAGVLHRRGFSVTVLHTAFNSPDPSHHPHFAFHSLKEDPLTHTDGSDLVGLLKALNDRCAAPFRDSLSELVATDVGKDEPVCCLVSDAIWSFTGSVANDVGVKTLVLRTGAAASFCAFAAFPLLRDKGYLPVDDSKLEEAVRELQPLKVKDLPVIQTQDQEGLYKIVDDMVSGIQSSSGVVFNTFEDLERSSLATLLQELQVSIFPIGPLHKHIETDNTSLPSKQDDDISTISWLDKQEPKSVLYVSFGSLASISEAEFLEIACGLSNSEQPFLWVVRPGLVHGSDWLEALPRDLAENLKGRGKIAKWVNQVEVLAHPSVGAFWSHCGWNSTLESISEGVPMICMPCFTDQRVNARYICDVWRIGVLLEGNKIDEREIKRVIKMVMVGREGSEMRDRALKLKEKAKLCLKQDGSSSKSLDSLVSHILSLGSFAFGS